MKQALIIYSTTDGHTIKICERICVCLQNANTEASLVNIVDVSEKDLANCDSIILGASIRYGKHQKSVHDFIQKNISLLENIPSAFFSVCLVARKPEKRTAETNPYLKKFLQKIDWKPALVTVFAGKLDYPRYSFRDRQIIRFIMWLTKGPTHPSAVVEYTDWDEVEQFAQDFRSILKVSEE